MGCLYSRPIIYEEEQIIRYTENTIPFQYLTSSQLLLILQTYRLGHVKGFISSKGIESVLHISIDSEDHLHKYFNQYFTQGTYNISLLIVAAILYSKVSETEKTHLLYSMYKSELFGKLSREVVGKMILDMIDISVDKCIGLVIECIHYDPRSIKVRNYLEKLKFRHSNVIKRLTDEITTELSDITEQMFLEAFSSSVIRQILSPAGLRRYLNDMVYRKPEPWES